MKRLTQKIAAGATALASLALASTSVASAATTNTNVSTKQRSEMHWEKRGEHGPGPGMVFDKNVQRTVTNISNGVQTTLTSTDAATVTKLQSMKEPPAPPADSKLTVTRTNIANGVQITITSTDPATVTKIQEREKNGPGFGGPRKGHGPMMFDQKIQRTVENITNGTTVTLTSTDADTVKRLQSFDTPPAPADAKITVTKVNIANGVQITTTSTDAATVTKIQDHEKRGPGFGRGFGHHGRPGEQKPEPAAE